MHTKCWSRERAFERMISHSLGHSDFLGFGARLGFFKPNKLPTQKAYPKIHVARKTTAPWTKHCRMRQNIPLLCVNWFQLDKLSTIFLYNNLPPSVHRWQSTATVSVDLQETLLNSSCVTWLESLSSTRSPTLSSSLGNLQSAHSLVSHSDVNLCWRAF